MTEELVKCMKEMEYLPFFLKERAEKIREIDEQVKQLSSKIERELISDMDTLLQFSMEEKTKLHNETMDLYAEIDRLSEQKVKLTTEMYEVVNRHAREMDEKIANAEAMCKKLKEASLKPAVNTDEPVYCSCKQASSGKMIYCEGPECEIKWFHYSCVGLTKDPEGPWRCDQCSKKMMEN